MQSKMRWLLFFVLFAISCSNGKIRPAGAAASSTLPRTPNYTYGPEKAIDGSLDSAWAEGSNGDGTGEYLIIKFSGEKEIKSMQIVNGFASMHKELGDLYSLNNRVRELVVQFDDGSERVTLEDEMRGYQKHEFKAVHKSSSVKLTIASVHKGTRWNDACIAEVSFFGNDVGQNPVSSSTNVRQWRIADVGSGYDVDPPNYKYGTIVREGDPGVHSEEYTERECQALLTQSRVNANAESNKIRHDPQIQCVRLPNKK